MKLRNQYQNDPRTLKMMEDLKFERESFAREVLELLKIYQEELQDLAMDSLLSPYRGRNLATLNEGEKKEILKGIAALEEKIAEKNKRESVDGEIPEGAHIVAREKVLDELEEIKKALRTESKLVEEAKIESKEEKRISEEEKNKNEKELKEEVEKVKEHVPR